jgi:hypothetical protein
VVAIREHPQQREREREREEEINMQEDVESTAPGKEER